MAETIDVDNLEIENTYKIFQSLSGILPDADPVYLQHISQEYSLNSDNLDSHIDNLLRSNNYPKKKKETSQETLGPPINISHRNSVREFIKKFNDPVKHFTENATGNAYIEFSKIYLKNKYKFMSVKIINDVLKNNKWNLTESKRALDVAMPDRISKRGKHEIKAYDAAANEDFLDEVYFLDNEDEIKRELTEEAEFSRIRLEEAKINKELLECQCCFNDEVFPCDILTCSEGHLFCKSCVKRSTEIAFADGKTKFSCLIECDSEFPLKTLEGLLSNSLFRKIFAKIQEEEIKSADISGICFCPYCEYAEVLPEHEKIFTCKCCNKESCRFCQSENHIPLSCKEYDEDKKKNGARTQIEDKMTEALLRECYKCKKKFIKQDGCNKMLCICGAVMCYICRQPVRDYSHFEDQRRPYNQQPTSSTSSDISKRCPLWSNNNDLHVDAVIKAAEAATAEMQLQNPELNFEKKQLLKGLKRKSHYTH